MASPTNTPSTGDIWHLSIDDLFAPLPEAPRLGGPGPFVINLSASTAPIGIPTAEIAGCERWHLYQIQRLEDRRMRYRLRLGPFANEDEADAALAKVRDIYPSALTATADGDDMRVIAAMKPKTVAAPAPAAAAATAAAPVVAAPAAAAPTARPAPTAPKAPTAPTVPTVLKAPTALTAPTAAKPSVSPKAPTPAVPAKPLAVASMPALPAPPTLALAAAVVHAVGQREKQLPSLESTQTVRALTSLELKDEGVLRWFVIQLSLAENAFDPDTVPILDIFSVYRLYSVAGIDQGRIMHALRLGFFSEESAALAVASYLAAYYEKPSVKRVSIAERDRFANQRLEPRKEVGGTGKHAVIEITNERYIREKRMAAATATRKSKA